jgi:predicted small lipoprotein YifL
MSPLVPARPSSFLRIAPLLLAAVLLSACGNKGPLVRPAPDSPPPAESTG